MREGWGLEVPAHTQAGSAKPVCVRAKVADELMMSSLIITRRPTTPYVYSHELPSQRPRASALE
eukprot:6780-Eustigmatos_ZCMA.PRE.1